MKGIETVKINARGQITLPVDIRQELNLKEGDKLLIVRQGGKIVLENPTKAAFEKIRNAMDGEAERLGLKDVDDAVKLIKEVRTERRGEKEKSFKALKGILAGYEIDLDKEREERILSE